MRRAAALATLLAALPLVGAGCGADSPPDMRMMTAVWWNRDPSTVDDVGYKVLVDFGWPDRSTDCFPLSPDLKLHVNDREVKPTAPGLCQWDILVQLTGFKLDQPLNIRITDGDNVLGTAVFTGMFPGAGAQIVSPVGGTVHAGEKIVLTIPAEVAPFPNTFGADFYWRDTPDGVPPFYTFSPASAGAEAGTIETTAPTLTGRAFLSLQTIWPLAFAPAQTCEGFTDCTGEPNNDTLGPIGIEVVP